MFNILKKFINKKVTVIYIEEGIEKTIVGILTNVEDYRNITIKSDVLRIMGFISNFSAIKQIRYMGIPIYNNKYLPPHYGYNPLKLPSNVNEKNKIKKKIYERRTK